ncbi:aspartate--tRNA(Asn) ligase, partial [Candidatus Microgenomates bacterium]|nr:aspartate--tRNA(Asn) ligase [Candidatus Microgenomates bacterium]
MRTLNRELMKHSGKIVELDGWLHKKRLLGGINFIVLRDRSGLTQIKVDEETEVDKLRNLQIGTVLHVKGQVAKDERAPGGVEIHNPQLSIEVPVTEVPPIEIDKPLSHQSEHLDTLFDNRVIGLRNSKEQAIFKIQARVLEALRAYFGEHEFTEFKSPKLLAAATEGGAEVFKVDYFGREATLAQSAQFYKQMMVGVFERVFEIDPTYRAEPSATTRHMTEYITVDAEMGFISFDDLLEFTGGLLNFVVDYVWKEAAAELKLWEATKPKLSRALPILPMAKIHELYSEATGEKTTGEADLRPDEERWICEYSATKLGSEAVFVTEWPLAGMKFYHRVNSANPKIVDRSDLLFRGVEIATVPMREHRYEVLVDQLKKLTGGDPDNLGFAPYLSAFK